MMISWLLLLLTGCVTSFAQSPTETVQRLFDAMASHDTVRAGSLFLPEATLVSLKPGAPTVVTLSQKFIERLGSSKDQWLERMWNPKVLDNGSIAVVWAEYDFHLNGTFSHCGIDSVNLVKTDASWKIASVVYTSETEGCPVSPLGPLPKK